MRALDLVHRWTGGLIGLVLTVLGLSGTALLHEEAWIGVPDAGDPLIHDPAALAGALARIMAMPGPRPQSIVFARDGFGLHQIHYGHEAGAYADQAGRIVTRWASEWQRPELWLFDLHHHLLAGEIGETVIGIAALCGLFFVVSGTILWWRTRRTFAPRLLPSRLSRSAIVRHHRDLGILVAPLLLLSFVTGALMVFRPLTVILGTGTPAAITMAGRPPAGPRTPASLDIDWRALVSRAVERFPGAEPRVLTLPGEKGGPIALRLRQDFEWMPNGRTQLWFAPDTGVTVGVRDAASFPTNVAVYNMLYPLHAAKVGGLAFRLVMTVAGLALSLLGSLAVYSFWFERRRKSRTDPLLADPISFPPAR